MCRFGCVLSALGHSGTGIIITVAQDERCWRVSQAFLFSIKLGCFQRPSPIERYRPFFLTLLDFRSISPSLHGKMFSATALFVITISALTSNVKSAPHQTVNSPGNGFIRVSTCSLSQRCTSFTLVLQRGAEAPAVEFCTANDLQGTCIDFFPGNDQCISFGSDFNDMVSSVHLQPGTTCVAFV